MAKICGNYVNSVFAKREAAKNGYDEAYDAQFAEGKVSEGTGENIFVVKKGKMYHSFHRSVDSWTESLETDHGTCERKSDGSC